MLPGGGKVRYIYNGGSLDSVITYASGGSVTCYLKYLYNASGELEYILRKKDNFSDSNRYDLFAVVYNGKGEITKLVQTRKQTSTGVGFQFRVVANYTYDAYGSVTVSSPISGEDLGVVNPLRYKNYIYDSETDWYYLQTRFYDPAVGRFLNADGVVADVGGSIKGYNLFTYCYNNPVNMGDQAGNWPEWLKNSVKWVAKNIVKPIVKTVQKKLSKANITKSNGINVSGSPGIFSFNLQVGISADTKGNVAIQCSYGGGISTSGMPSFSMTKYKSTTNASSIADLNDLSYQLGGAVGIPVEGVPIYAGIDLNIIPNEEKKKTYYGATVTKGIGTAGVETHVEWGNTVTLESSQFNIYDIGKSIYIKIIEW